MFSRYTSINSINLHSGSARHNDWRQNYRLPLCACRLSCEHYAESSWGEASVIDGLGKRQLSSSSLFQEFNVVTHHHQL